MNNAQCPILAITRMPSSVCALFHFPFPRLTFSLVVDWPTVTQSHVFTSKRSYRLACYSASAPSTAVSCPASCSCAACTPRSAACSASAAACCCCTSAGPSCCSAAPAAPGSGHSSTSKSQMVASDSAAEESSPASCGGYTAAAHNSKQWGSAANQVPCNEDAMGMQ